MPAILWKRSESVRLTTPDALRVVDEDTASALFVITQCCEPDGDGDVCLISGCDLSRFEQNPVWLWAHNANEDRPPIGTSRNPRTGDLAVFVEEDRILARCFFNRASPFAMNLFRSVRAGVIRATSIAFIPIDAVQRSERPLGAERPGFLYRAWELTEISLVACGANKDAVLAKALRPGCACGSASPTKSSDDRPPLTRIGPEPWEDVEDEILESEHEGRLPKPSPDDWHAIIEKLEDATNRLRQAQSIWEINGHLDAMAENVEYMRRRVHRRGA